MGTQTDIGAMLSQARDGGHCQELDEAEGSSPGASGRSVALLTP